MALNGLAEFLNIVKDNVSTNSVELQKQLSVDYVQVIARDTPVDTGRATANWLAGINRDPRGGLSIFDKSSTARPTADRARKDLNILKFGDEVIIRNAVEDESDDPQGYILKLEMGSSPQARTGMFRKHVIRSKQMVRLSKKKIGL
jgi:hypothetical protein